MSATTSFVEPERFCGIGMNTCKNELKHRKEKLKASLWENVPGLRHSKVLLVNFNNQIAKSMLELSRNKLLVLGNI